MSNKEISFVIGLILFSSFIFIQIISDNSLGVSIQKRICSNQFHCRVLKKEKEIMNHGQLKIYCSDLLNDSDFVIYPDNIIPANILYYQTEKGDTLLKEINSNYFLIINGNKRDTFRFKCD